MLCANPISIGGTLGLVGCGQCLPCKINRRRLWVHRIMLESLLCSDNTFVSLSYDEESLPRLEDGRGTLVPKDMQDFMKRLRKAIEPLKVRYYGVGEYGETTERPHFHFALFNYPNCSYGKSRYSSLYDSCCAHCDLIRGVWGRGTVLLGDLNEQSASYIAEYTVKKMTASTDIRLNGRHPEFARMSNRPGIGADMMHDVASTLMTLGLDTSQADVPSALRHGRRIMPIGRYLQRRLRTLVGKAPNAPPEALAPLEENLQRLRAIAQETGRGTAAVYLEENKQKILNVENRYNIFTKAKK